MLHKEIKYPVENLNGSPRAVVANAIHALNQHSEWTGVLGYDTFSMRTAAMRPPAWVSKGNAPFEPCAWTDTDDIRTADWLQKNNIFVSPDVARQAVEVAARRQEFHPVNDYLDSLKWDGRARIDNLSFDYFGAEKTPYTQAVSPAFLIGAVARVKQPGCKADAMPVFEGQQDAGKSSAMDAMFSPWFSDEMADPGSKDAAMQLQGAWCIEIAELDAFSRAETTRIKAFLSRRNDRFRPPYGTRVSEFPRQCIFAGTTNKDDYLRDETGGRRFWPIKCGRIDLDAIHRDRDQLWAEAVARHRKGARWWLDPQTARMAMQQQAERYVGDAWEPAIRAWIHNRDDVSIAEILEMALDIKKDRWSQQDQNRVARILISERYDCGAAVWKRQQKRIDGHRQHRYIRQPDPIDEADRVMTAVTRLRVVHGGTGDGQTGDNR